MVMNDVKQMTPIEQNSIFKCQHHTKRKDRENKNLPAVVS